VLLILSSLSDAFDVTTSCVLISISSAAPLLDEVHPVKANINVRDNKTTNIFFIICSPSVSWMFCFCCYMYHIGERLKQIVISKK
jgi:hypothetical protein